MSYFLPHLPSGWHVDEAIKSEDDRVVVIRFGHDWDQQCMVMDETLHGVAEKVQNFAVIYLVDITDVPDFNKMYELYDPCTVMFFYRNKHIMIDLGTGNNNKINWAMDNKQELIDIIETVYRGASKGRGLVVSPKGKALARSFQDRTDSNSFQTTPRDTVTKGFCALDIQNEDSENKDLVLDRENAVGSGDCLLVEVRKASIPLFASPNNIELQLLAVKTVPQNLTNVFKDIFLFNLICGYLNRRWNSLAAWPHGSHCPSRRTSGPLEVYLRNICSPAPQQCQLHENENFFVDWQQDGRMDIGKHNVRPALRVVPCVEIDQWAGSALFHVRKVLLARVRLNPWTLVPLCVQRVASIALSVNQQVSHRPRRLAGEQSTPKPHYV
ncbi:hypothetical protein NM688_g7368 [Phlebia brevispora]|uniref:Uncharacterized protein n=1 Tax=Phlebia brevispora TaxID=194682 RepID=A0ACC1S617_9APHY|nr:hypothetical protein NM688_g7368 [Phlebia brevispora]